MNAKQLLEGMMNDTTYTTTRGTMGDADGITIIDDYIIENLGDCEVISLIELKNINSEAYSDMIDFISRECPNTTPEDYYVIIEDCNYTLAWI